MKFTYGAEYELGDVDRTLDLLPGANWNFKDHSIANSTGIANDEKAKLYTIGGEINTDPTDTVEGQLDIFKGIKQVQPRIHINHRTNLHLHVGVPGLKEDLGLLKKLMEYVQANQGFVYESVELVPEPCKEDYATEAAYKGALARKKRRLISHQNRLKPNQVSRCMAATTPQEFIDGHAPVSKKGKVLWALATRGGINISQLRETGTIEFRHFTPTLELDELESCFRWVRDFMEAALYTGESAQSVYERQTWKFPAFAEYDHNLDVVFRWTDLEKNNRTTIKSRLDRLAEHFDIYRQPAVDLAPFVIKESGGALEL